MNKVLIYFIALLLINSCGGSSRSDISENFSVIDDDVMFEAEYDDMVSDPVSRSSVVGNQVKETQNNLISIDKKIVKDATIGIEVESFTNYRLKLDSLLGSLNAYISNDNLNKNDYSINSNLIIRIPSENFDVLVNCLEKGSTKLLYKNISARDVTEEFIDIEARLKTKKKVEERYIQLLSKAKNIKEILEVEEKLRVIREEIEAREGRLNYLKKQVTYSTIHLNITQKLEYKYEPNKQKKFFQRLIKSLDKGWKGFISFLLFIFRIWPVIVIGLVIFYYIRKMRRKRKQKKNNQLK